MRSLHTTPMSSPTLCNWRKPKCSNKDPPQSINEQIHLKKKMLIIMSLPFLTELLRDQVSLIGDYTEGLSTCKARTKPLWLWHACLTAFVLMTQTEWHKCYNIEKQNVTECRTTFPAWKRFSSHLFLKTWLYRIKTQWCAGDGPASWEEPILCVSS